MKPTQAIQDKAIELSALYAAVANGRELQYDWSSPSDTDRAWRGPGNHSPDLRSDLSRWRVKPGPRTLCLISHPDRMGACFAPIDECHAEQCRSLGYTVSKWTEVLS
jgi:hypothetical protein